MSLPRYCPRRQWLAPPTGSGYVEAMMVRLAAALAALAVVAPAPARADESVATTLTASGGWTDNVLSAPNEPGPTDPSIESDAFTQLSPGIVFSQESRRLLQVATYTFSANLFASHSEANSYSNQLGWQAIYSLSPRSELTLGASASNGRLNTFNTQGQASDTGLNQLPNGGVSFATGDVQESIRHELSRAWTLRQLAAARLFKPLDDMAALGTNVYWNNSFGAVHAWRYDSLGLDLRADYTAFGAGTSTNGTAIGSNKQITVGPSLRYLHDFTDSLSGELSGGAVAVVQANDLGSQIVQPVGTAALRYIRDAGRVELVARHTVAPNLFVAQTTANDEVLLRGGLPVPLVQRAGISGSVGYSRGRILDAQMGGLIGSTKLFVVDVAASWNPREALFVSLRFQRFDQLRSQVVTDTSQSFARNQVILSISGRYPARDAARLPSRTPDRVDQSDQQGLGQTDPSDHTDADADERR